MIIVFDLDATLYDELTFVKKTKEFEADHQLNSLDELTMDFIHGLFRKNV